MDPISLLLLLYAASQSNSGSSGKRPRSAPKWPTPKSPPPMPAFQARKTAPPSADPHGSSTPLAQLQAAPPVPPPASAIDNAKHAATNAIRRRTSALLAKQALTLNPFAKKAPPTSSALVSNLQKILNNNGVRVVQDGLYGPRTANAWAALAKRKGLPPAISRESPKVAKVVTQTFEQLQMPAIP